MTASFFTATARGKFSGEGLTCRCALGKGGIVGANLKREGDGATPLGTWAMKRVFYRPDRLVRPKTGLPVVPLRETDGWCDAPDHALYNRPVTLPFAASHETLWREDHVYDLIVELGHNDNPPVPGLGSAIFFHLAHEDYRPTEGCIAIAREDMLTALALSAPGSAIEVSF
ncbi:L,D-transpeptidase family protein [Hyphomonas sp. FCG-A18]|uniref:L,D-transpeptidase family protein n=1 Tax=Hyphomonas sp. FCG-A18 TaxID=3080019 RepID=UPI002B304B09|nr:L,D-transpeptidase family protein [Hyphomonas sp. FCG-A18]